MRLAAIFSPFIIVMFNSPSVLAIMDYEIESNVKSNHNYIASSFPSGTDSTQNENVSVLSPVNFLLLRPSNEGLCLDNDNDNFFASEGCNTLVDCNDNDPNVHPNALDVPDEYYHDENCDGIDGDKSMAVFVATTGNDLNNGLNTLTPKRTLASALQTAGSTGRKQILIQQGLYNEIIDMPYLLDGGLYGNYDLNWSRSQSAAVEIRGGYYSPDDLYLTIRAHNSSGSFNDLRLVGPDAVGTHNSTGHSSNTVHAKNSTLSFYRIEFAQGNGANGLDGSNGTSYSQTQAPSGQPGENADSYSTLCNSSDYGSGGNYATSSCSTDTRGGTGGDGGTMDTDCSSLPYDYDARPGSAGTSAMLSGSGYGNGGGEGAVCAAGLNGENGKVTNGSGGIAPSASSLLSGDHWYGAQGGEGGFGDHGTGGGGGGGSGGCDTDTDSHGAGGGGGGAGGCRAMGAGTGGFSGGGSFGIFALNSTIKVQECSFQRGEGGRGGSGGRGGMGQPSGTGGSGGGPAGGSAAGGSGGTGGNGGHSGGGAGGGGGYSYGIFYSDSTISEIDNTFVGGLEGSGGVGGSIAGGNQGQDGPSGILGTSASM
jgi:hypothetical protein